MVKILGNYVTFKIKTLHYFGTYDISIDSSHNLNDVITAIKRLFCLVYSDVWTLLREIYNIQTCADPQTFWLSLKSILLTKILAKVTIAHQFIPWKTLKIWKILKALYFTKLN